MWGKEQGKLGEISVRLLNVRIYGDCGTPIWRCAVGSQLFENITQEVVL